MCVWVGGGGTYFILACLASVSALLISFLAAEKQTLNTLITSIDFQRKQMSSQQTNSILTYLALNLSKVTKI